MKLRGTLAAASALAVAALAIATSPASAGDVGIQSVQEFQGIGVGEVSIGIHHSDTLLLDHFWFRDVSDDQHLHRVEVMPPQERPGNLLVDFTDKNPDEQYEYRIAHQRVSGQGMTAGNLHMRCWGRCLRSVPRPSNDHIFVLSGFMLRFRSDPWVPDRHIDEIGVLENNGVLSVYYNDQNDDDEFEVSLKYMWVPRSMLSSISVVSASRVHATGTAQRTIAAGNKVIRGFHVDNLASGGSGDNHIKRFGFLTNSTTVDVYYGDQNPADSADWSFEFRYATLN